MVGQTALARLFDIFLSLFNTFGFIELFFCDYGRLQLDVTHFLKVNQVEVSLLHDHITYFFLL